MGIVVLRLVLNLLPYIICTLRRIPCSEPELRIEFLPEMVSQESKNGLSGSQSHTQFLKFQTCYLYWLFKKRKTTSSQYFLDLLTYSMPNWAAYFEVNFAVPLWYTSLILSLLLWQNLRSCTTNCSSAVVARFDVYLQVVLTDLNVHTYI